MRKKNTFSARNLPRHRIVTLLKERGVTQADIGARLGVHHSFISNVIARRYRHSAQAHAVWAELDRILGEEATR